MSTAPPLPEELLLDYAAGSLGPATELLMATHLAMSSKSRDLLALMEAVGGAMLDDLEDEPLERISADSALDLVDGNSTRAQLPNDQPLMRSGPRKGTPAVLTNNALPEPLRRAEVEVGGDRRWRRLGFGVAATKLAVSTERERAHLLWAKGGTAIANHRHVGRETVLVLKGAFWDNGVRYGECDVAVCEDGTIHGPSIDRSGDCVCLAVTEAPVHFTGPLGFALNRFCRF